ncbi:hypothetical protein LBMAG46_40200 [Planctomycetia bacterium]|nr:hypothetical protein LBMAG46_40200 [Planctomycetia bacterium]
MEPLGCICGCKIGAEWCIHPGTECTLGLSGDTEGDGFCGEVMHNDGACTHEYAFGNLAFATEDAAAAYKAVGADGDESGGGDAGGNPGIFCNFGVVLERAPVEENGPGANGDAGANDGAGEDNDGMADLCGGGEDC